MKPVEAKDCSSHSCSVLSEVEMRCKSDQTSLEVHELPAVSVGFEPVLQDCEHLPTTETESEGDANYDYFFELHHCTGKESCE